MLSTEVTENLKQGLALLDRGKYFGSLLNLARENRETIKKLSEDSQWLKGYGVPKEFSPFFSKLRDEISKLPIRVLFGELDRFQQDLQEASVNKLIPDSMARELIRLMNYVSTWLEQSFARQMSEFSLFVLIKYIDDLAQLIDIIGIIYVDVSGKLSVDQDEMVEHTDDVASFSLYLESYPTFNQFILKLDAVNTIYNELAQIMNVSLTDNPLLIRKVESGSVWQDILGYPKIIDLIVKLVEDTVDYFYRNFTQDGKISTLPRNVDAIESVLHLRNKLQAANVNTKEMDESLSKCSVIIAQQLNVLLIGETKVRVNHHERYIGDEFADKYLEASETLLLMTGANHDGLD